MRSSAPEGLSGTVPGAAGSWGHGVLPCMQPSSHTRSCVPAVLPWLKAQVALLKSQTYQCVSKLVSETEKSVTLTRSKW